MEREKIILIDDCLPICHLNGIYGHLIESDWSLKRQGNRFYHDNNNRLTKDFSIDDDLYILSEAIKEISIHINMSMFEISEVYANLYTNETVTTIHTDHYDKQALTALYFVTPEWEVNWGGELLFFSNDKEIESGLTYKPNRMIIFPSNTPHKVCTVSSSAKSPRLSLAFKLIRKN
jgi:Rps23 Pro-64 3,4-dihydroxylase Tpa1-like proline 4-hydroxylase